MKYKHPIRTWKTEDGIAFGASCHKDGIRPLRLTIKYRLYTS